MHNCIGDERPVAGCRIHNPPKATELCLDACDDPSCTYAACQAAINKEKPMAVAENLSIEIEIKPWSFIFMGENSKKLVEIDFDGNVELFGDVNEAALRFWTAVCQLSGGMLTKQSSGKLG